MEYKKTLNMTKSGFPMRAGLPKREPEMLKHWEELDLYHELLKKNEGKPRFALHDGPPFSNGALHMGHALNKSIKDFITRSYAMATIPPISPAGTTTVCPSRAPSSSRTSSIARP